MIGGIFALRIRIIFLSVFACPFLNMLLNHENIPYFILKHLFFRVQFFVLMRFRFGIIYFIGDIFDSLFLGLINIFNFSSLFIYLLFLIDSECICNFLNMEFLTRGFSAEIEINSESTLIYNSVWYAEIYENTNFFLDMKMACRPCRIFNEASAYSASWRCPDNCIQPPLLLLFCSTGHTTIF